MVVYIRMIRRKKWLITGLLATFLVAAGGIGFAVHHKVPVKIASSKLTKTPTKTITKPPQPAAQSNAIRLIATGDELPHDSVNAAAKTATGYDYLPLYANIKPYLLSGDISYCNQESPSDPQLGVSGYPTFNAPASFAQDLNQLGCNVINLANNHADDRGQAGIDQTRQLWDGLHTLAVAGANRSQQEQNTIPYFTVKGVKFAFLSYAQCSNNKGVSSYGLNIMDKTFVGNQISEAKQHADMIIAAMHSCDENRNTEDSFQDDWAQFFASNGVNIVIGTGPHWLQPVKKLPRAGGGDTVVWFSLGNLLSSQEEIQGLIGGIAYMDIDPATKQVTNLSFLPTYMHYEWTAAQKAAEDLSARHNLLLYPLDQAAAPLARSQNNTTVAAQTQYVTDLLNKYTKVTILTSATAPRK